MNQLSLMLCNGINLSLFIISQYDIVVVDVVVTGNGTQGLVGAMEYSIAELPPGLTPYHY